MSNLNPYNPVNKKIRYQDINNILNKLDIRLKINNLNIYQSSLLHKSYTFKNNYEYNNSDANIVERPKDCIELFNIDSYENLEFLGDRVIDLSAVEYLFKRFSNRTNEGFMTKLKIKLVKKDSLAKYSKFLGLDSKDSNKGGRKNKKSYRKKKRNNRKSRKKIIRKNKKSKKKYKKNKKISKRKNKF